MATSKSLFERETRIIILCVLTYIGPIDDNVLVSTRGYTENGWHDVMKNGTQSSNKESLIPIASAIGKLAYIYIIYVTKIFSYFQLTYSWMGKYNKRTECPCLEVTVACSCLCSTCAMLIYFTWSKKKDKQTRENLIMVLPSKHYSWILIEFF